MIITLVWRLLGEGNPNSLLPCEINPYWYSSGDFFDADSPYFGFRLHFEVDDEVCLSFFEDESVERFLSVSLIPNLPVHHVCVRERKCAPLVFFKLPLIQCGSACDLYLYGAGAEARVVAHVTEDFTCNCSFFHFYYSTMSPDTQKSAGDWSAGITNELLRTKL